MIMEAKHLLKSFLACWCLVLMTAIGNARGGNLISSLTENRDAHGDYVRLEPFDAEGEQIGASFRHSIPLTDAQRESILGDHIVNVVNDNEAFARLRLQPVQTGPTAVRLHFSTHLVGHVQARFLADSTPMVSYENVVKPKMWQYTAQHFTPILRGRVAELLETLPGDTQEGATALKTHIRNELPTFDSRDLAMQSAVEQVVEEARRAAITAGDPHPERAAQRTLERAAGWHLKRSEYGHMITFVDRSVDDILSGNRVQRPVEELLTGLHVA